MKMDVLEQLRRVHDELVDALDLVANANGAGSVTQSIAYAQGRLTAVIDTMEEGSDDECEKTRGARNNDGSKRSTDGRWEISPDDVHADVE